MNAKYARIRDSRAVGISFHFISSFSTAPRALASSHAAGTGSPAGAAAMYDSSSMSKSPAVYVGFSGFAFFGAFFFGAFFGAFFAGVVGLASRAGFFFFGPFFVAPGAEASFAFATPFLPFFPTAMPFFAASFFFAAALFLPLPATDTGFACEERGGDGRRRTTTTDGERGESTLRDVSILESGPRARDRSEGARRRRRPATHRELLRALPRALRHRRRVAVRRPSLRLLRSALVQEREPRVERAELLRGRSLDDGDDASRAAAAAAAASSGLPATAAAVAAAASASASASCHRFVTLARAKAADWMECDALGRGYLTAGDRRTGHCSPHGHVEGRARGPICLSKCSPLDRESPVSLDEK